MPEAKVKSNAVQDTYVEETKDPYFMMDGSVQDMIEEVWPNEIDPKILGEMVEEMREFMIAQFERNGVATRDQLYNFNEGMDLDDPDSIMTDEEYLDMWGF